MILRLPAPLLLLALTAGLLTGDRMQAQPQISYIIPDIGAAGMNTSVEIVAPVDRPGSFNPGISSTTGVMPVSALEIELVNPRDTLRVVVSPGVVSWDGRLVSCQFFVHPNATPGPVPIRLRVNSARSNVDTFFIVTPQTLPNNATGPAVLGSGGAWGRRSKRGAMIVEALNLGSGSFTVDRSDTDPGTPGNQGLLPAVIISRTVATIGPGARFHVDANGKDGGPGGGGGGGYGNRTAFPPVPGERDTPLGSGFTGGRSDVPIVPANASSFGTGTGTGSASLNGVTANSQFTTTFPTFARLYGAGPGHPFDRDGRSGGAAAAASGAGVGIFGTYYSGGGNATKGSGAPPAQDAVNGQIIGNRQIVPLHGGGGGASGGANDSVGAGGGGGLALFSQGRTTVTTVAAAGADGADGCHNCGLGSGDAAAGGAGGSIIVGGKSEVVVTTVDVRGGVAGGRGPSAPAGSSSGDGGTGRYRFDGRLPNGAPGVTPGASVWTGPTIDTLTLIETPLFQLTGTGRFDAAEQTRIDIYMRGESSPWPATSPTATTTVRGDSTWSADVVIPSNDSIFYVFAVQSTPVGERQASDSSTRVPPVVFSQAAANILRYRPRPELIVLPAEKRDTILCDDGAIWHDSVIIRNRGAGALRIEQGGIALENPSGSTIGFGILNNPTLLNPYVMAPGQIDTLVITYDPRAFAGSPTTVVLSIRSDDPQNPVLTHTLSVLLAYDRWRRTEPPLPGPIDFGALLVGTSTTDTALVINTGFRPGTDIIVDSVWITKPALGVTVASRNIPQTVPIRDGDSLIIGLRYAPTTEDVLSDVYLCARTSAPCVDTICWLLSGRGVSSVLTLSKPSFTLSTPPCWDGSPVFDTIVVGNDGNAPFNLLDINLAGSTDFTLVAPAAYPVPVARNAPVPIIVRYVPSTPGSAAGSLLVATDIPGTPSFTIEIDGSSDRAAVTPSTDSLYLGTFCLDTPVDAILAIRNTGTLIDTIALRLASGNPFSLTVAREIIDPADSLTTLVSFTPTAVGRFVDTILVESEPCGLRDTIIVVGEVTAPLYSIEPDPLTFGSVPIGSSSQIAAVINNSNGTVPVRVASARVVTTDGELRLTTSTFPITVPAGTDGAINLTWGPSSLRQIPAGSYLEVILDAPCPDTIQVSIEGLSSVGGLLPYPNPLDFGAVVSCVESVDTVWVKNFGTSPAERVTLLESWLDPVDPNFSFALLDPSNPTPFIEPQDSIGFVVRYAPLNGPDGPQSTVLYLRTNSPIFDTLTVDLRGVRFSEGLTITGPPYGTVFPGGSEVQTFTVRNSGTAPIAINRFVIPPPFRRVVVRPQLPTLLIAGASLEIDIEFAPSDTGRFADSIVVDGIVQCDSLKLPISAVAATPERVTARWGRVTGEPAEQVLIPLEMIDDVAGLGITSMQIDVNHAPSMLFAEGVEFAGGIAAGWSVENFARRPGGATFEIRGPVLNTGAGTLLFLRARVLLGQEVSTPITSTGFSRLTSGTGTLAVDSGEFGLEGYCTIGSNRLVRIDGTFGIRAVAPQPAEETLSVEYETVEDGPTRLRLVDLLGREVATLADGYREARVYEAVLEQRIASGTYMLLLETRTGRDVRMVVVR